MGQPMLILSLNDAKACFNDSTSEHHRKAMIKEDMP